MISNGNITLDRNRIKAARWLFYISLFQLLACFAFPAIMFPARILLTIELLNALTVGMLFGLYFLAVNIHGFIIDKERKPMYLTIIGIICIWVIWTVITWRYIERMSYLTGGAN
jgi:hypothetical protein